MSPLPPLSPISPTWKPRSRPYPPSPSKYSRDPFTLGRLKDGTDNRRPAPFVRPVDIYSRLKHYDRRDELPRDNSGSSPRQPQTIGTDKVAIKSGEHNSRTRPILNRKKSERELRALPEIRPLSSVGVPFPSDKEESAAAVPRSATDQSDRGFEPLGQEAVWDSSKTELPASPGTICSSCSENQTVVVPETLPDVQYKLHDDVKAPWKIRFSWESASSEDSAVLHEGDQEPRRLPLQFPTGQSGRRNSAVTVRSPDASPTYTKQAFRGRSRWEDSSHPDGAILSSQKVGQTAAVFGQPRVSTSQDRIRALPIGANDLSCRKGSGEYKTEEVSLLHIILFI